MRTTESATAARMAGRTTVEAAAPGRHPRRLHLPPARSPRDMSANGRGLGPSIRTEGGLLPADLLARVALERPQGPGADARRLPPRRGAAVRRGDHEELEPARRRLGGVPDERAALPAGDPGTTVTRERWLLPLFDELGYGRLQRDQGDRDRRQDLPGRARLERRPDPSRRLSGRARPADGARRRRRRPGAARARPGAPEPAPRASVGLRHRTG